jgi:hypothetical protein
MLVSLRLLQVELQVLLLLKKILYLDIVCPPAEEHCLVTDSMMALHNVTNFTVFVTNTKAIPTPPKLG